MEFAEDKGQGWSPLRIRARVGVRGSFVVVVIEELELGVWVVVVNVRVTCAQRPN